MSRWRRGLLWSAALVLVSLGSTAPQRLCNAEAEEECRAEYVKCLLTLPVDMESSCECDTELYGVCLREAGCAADYMVECVAELREHNCRDMSVCGSNCVGSGDGLIPKSAMIMPVNNYGANYLRFSVCFLGVNQHQLNKFANIRMDRCDDSSFQVCPYWVPPKTFTALGFNPSATYIQMETCVYVEETNEVLIPNTTNVTLKTAYVYKCLPEVKPVEYYGSRGHWPSSVDVEFSEENFCDNDKHCPGSYCDNNMVPAKCAPKVASQFMEKDGAARSFIDAPFFHDDDL